MNKSTVLNIAAIIAIMSTGCVKADVIDDCLNQATTASAMVFARDKGTPIENIKGFTNEHYAPRFHPMLYRIIDTAYNTPTLTREAAYDDEMTYCMSHAPKEKVADK